jgi:hypothetical protein
VIGEGFSPRVTHAARPWWFVAVAFILAPLFCCGFLRIFNQSAIAAIPAVALALLAMSFVFGLWTRTFGTVVKVGVVAWAVAMACLSPVTLLVGLMYYCGFLNVQGGHFHYVCGL